MSYHFGLVAGEISGDILGAGLIRELKIRYPDARFSGIGGERMIAEGMQSLYPMERLSVMGLVEPLKRLPELLSIRKHLKQHFTAEKIDVFIGIDSPDFNLNIELYLKKRGVRTSHYVSPSVWAWRRGRIKKIRKAVDVMLTLLPFESKFYQEHGVPEHFVGHPLADEFDLDVDVEGARSSLNLTASDTVLAVLPGSRGGELRMLLPIFLQTIKLCLQDIPSLKVLLAAANQQRYEEITEALNAAQLTSSVSVSLGNSQQLMAASDVVLLASGTATLEAMLLKKPMVVAYKMAPLSYAIISRMLKVPYVALPNLLADKPLVPELIQDNATAALIVEQLLPLLKHEKSYQHQLSTFYKLHQLLRRGASERAAEAIAALVR